MSTLSPRTRAQVDLANRSRDIGKLQPCGPSNANAPQKRSRSLQPNTAVKRVWSCLPFRLLITEYFVVWVRTQALSLHLAAELHRRRHCFCRYSYYKNDCGPEIINQWWCYHAYNGQAPQQRKHNVDFSVFKNGTNIRGFIYRNCLWFVPRPCRFRLLTLSFIVLTDIQRIPQMDVNLQSHVPVEAKRDIVPNSSLPRVWWRLAKTALSSVLRLFSMFLFGTFPYLKTVLVIHLYIHVYADNTPPQAAVS